MRSIVTGWRPLKRGSSHTRQSGQKRRRAILIEALESRQLLAAVFQADFSGAGGGTGPGNLVTLGGTGSLYSGATSNMVASQTSSSPLVNPDSGGYLHIADNGLQSSADGAGVNIAPTSASTSFDSWYVNGGSSSFDTVNGGFDFFFRSSIPSTSWDTTSGTNFRAFNLWPTNSGLGLFLNSPTTNSLQLELVADNASGTAVMDLRASSSSVNFAANTIYHIAATSSTDGTGKVTVKLFAAPGNVAIDPSTSTYLLASATSTSAMDPAGTNAINHAFNSASGFLFGKTYNYDSIAQSQDFDTFRIYNAVPTSFAAISSSSPFITSQSLTTLRNDYTGWVGFKFTTGSSPITVSQLGRWAVSGNTQTHSVKLVDAATGADVPGATVSVNTAGVGGQYVYSSLTSPVTLLASHSYYLASLETYGADQWYQDTSTITASAGATVNSSIYLAGTTWNVGTAGNHSFGPPNMMIISSASPALTYPDLPSPNHPADNPALPGNMDPFSPPVNTSSPATNTPTIAEYTRSAGPGDSLVVTGNQLTSYSGTDLGKDTAFIAYGQTGGAGVTASSSIAALEPDKATITLSSSLPAGSAYMLWTRNSNGYDRPVMVNTAQAWWVGPDTATAGQSISLYGQNLSYHGGTSLAWIYIKPASGAGQWATVTAVNPYKVTFSVPAGLAAGTYQVWAHNGSGGNYGWSDPATLTVTTGYTNTYLWSTAADHTFNVQSYGAVPNDGVDDTTAFRNAIAAAHNVSFSTVRIPAGTYNISGVLQMYSNMRVLGDGATSSKLVGASNDFISWGGPVFQLGTVGAGLSNLAFQSLGIDTSNDGNNKSFSGTASFLSLTNVNMTQLSVLTYAPTLSGTSYLDHCDHVFITGCNNIGGSFGCVTSRQVFVDSTNFYGANDAELFFGNNGMNEFAATNNTGQDYNNSVSWGWSQGVWWKFLNGGSSAEHGFYFENNTSHDLAVRLAINPNNPNDGNLENWGEQYSWEQEYSKLVAGPVHNGAITASVTGATSNTVTFNATVPVPSGTNQYMAVIVNGKGVGQWRTITAYNGGTITLDKPWNLIPDTTTSTIAVMAGAQQIAIYRNTMDGKSDRAALPDIYPGSSPPQSYCENSAAIQPYGGVYGMVADNNTVTDTRYGFYEWTATNESSGDIEPNYFHLYINNKTANNRFGIFQKSEAPSGNLVPVTYLMGMVYRNNNLGSSIGSASGEVMAGVQIAGPAPSTVARWTNMNVFEKGVISNTPTAVDLASQGAPTHLGNFVFLNNRSSLGTASFSGSSGVKFASSDQLVELENNTWSGFQSTYTGTSRGAVLDTPIPCIEVQIAAGSGTVNNALTLWNEGTSSLSWTAGDDASWLSLASTSGSIGAEGSSQTGLTIDPTGLATGTYTGTISISLGGVVTRKVTIRLIVV